MSWPGIFRRQPWEDPAFSALWRLSSERAEEALSARYDAAQTGTDGAWARAVQVVKKYLFLDNLDPVYFYSQKLQDGNALAVLSNFGHFLVGSAEVMTLAGVTVGAAGAAVEKGSENIILNVLSLGGAAAAGGATSYLLNAAMVMIFIVAGAIFSAGAALAFYLPALPWILWMSAVIGWLILVVESLFAAPLWAVGHMIPSGDGLAGQHGRQGYMLFLGVLARPPLMVAGFFTSLIIFSFYGNFVGRCFSIFYASVSTGHLLGVTSSILYIIILTSSMIVFSHKIFALMNTLPEKVVNWLGQLQQNLGEESDEARIRSTVVAGGAAIGQGHGAGGTGGGTHEGKKSTEKKITEGDLQ